ncbi:hypothetical protein N431DRAFT_443432 [Stipitochalara longipes BDJ]|nr:hypothetical protein N431DRAFT_443432 [Stipitochalara longipes BDJ]
MLMGKHESRRRRKTIDRDDELKLSLGKKVSFLISWFNIAHGSEEQVADFAPGKATTYDHPTHVRDIRFLEHRAAAAATNSFDIGKDKKGGYLYIRWAVSEAGPVANIAYGLLYHFQTKINQGNGGSYPAAASRVGQARKRRSSTDRASESYTMVLGKN